MRGARHRAPILLLAITGLPFEQAAAQERPPHIEFDMTVFSGRNPFLEPNTRAMISGVQVTAQGDATLSIDRKTTMGMDGAISYRRYDRRYGDFMTGRARVTMDYRDGPKLTMHTEASYERFLPLENLSGGIDGAIDPISLQEQYLIQQSAEWRPDSLTTLNGFLSWTRRQPIGSALLTRNDATNATVAARRRISTYGWIGLEGRATKGDFGDGRGSDAAGFALTAGTRLGPYLNGRVEVGGTTVSRPGTDGRGPLKPTGAVSLCYDPRRLQVCLSGRVAPVVTSFGGILREKSVSGTVEWQAGERTTVRATGDWRLVPRPEFGSDITMLRFTSSYERQLDSRLRLHVGADYDRRNGTSTRPIDSWTVRVGITFRIPNR